MTEDDKPLQQPALFDSRGRRPQQRWINAAQKREAETAAWFARPADEVAADMARLEDLLVRRAPWKFASTMADNPHCYSLRRRWTWPHGDEDFQWVVATIRVIADRERYPPSGRHARWYRVLHLGGAIYWTMNWPINYPNGTPCTSLINRKPPFLPGDRR